MSSSSVNSEFDIHRIPAKEYLVSKVTEIGYDPSTLDPIMERALIEGIKEVEELVKDGNSLPWDPDMLQVYIKQHSLVFVKAVLQQNKKWDKLHDSIKAYRSIVIVGAGLSFESEIPLTRTLNDLLTFCSSSDFEELRKKNENCLRFKHQFKTMCNNKSPSTSHLTLAKSFHKHIFEIICLNWDNLIERVGE